MTFTSSTATSFGPASGEGPDGWQSAKPRADVADFDNDGRLDIIKTQFPSNIGLWRNTVDNEGNRWMKVRVRGGGGNSDGVGASVRWRSEEHTSELQSLMRSSYAVFCVRKKSREYSLRIVSDM